MVPDIYVLGDYVDGANNKNLYDQFSKTNLIDSCYHSLVHYWYHGTIDLSESLKLDCDTITKDIRDVWYTPNDFGYKLSRIANGQALRGTIGANAGLKWANASRSNDYTRYESDIQWPNIELENINDKWDVTVGDTVQIRYRYQNFGVIGVKTTFDIELITDTDRNPYNNSSEKTVFTTTLDSTGSAFQSSIFSWTPKTDDNGKYLYAKITYYGHTRYHYLSKPITVQPAPTLTPKITSVSPPTLQTSSSPQPITIYGSNFLPSNDPNASTLIFYDPENNPYPRTPTYINSGELRYNITVQLATGTWKVKVVNGGVESSLYTFTVTSGTVQLTGLSIFGPATVAENNNGQFTATAYFSDGSSPTVTSSTSWSEDSSATNFPSPGLLTAESVSSDTLVTVSARYTAGSITRTANANVTIVNTGGGGTQAQELIFNGGFEFGKIIWSANTLSGGASGSADIVQLAYPHLGTWYAYVGDLTPTSSNALGSLHQRIHIPANATSIVLNFYLNVKTEETTVGPYDKMDVNLRNASDVLIKKLRTFSEADKGTNTSGSYSLVTIDMTADLAAYKDQDVILQFYVDTNSAKYTIFRIDDVSVQAVVPLPVTLSSLAIKGPSSVTEGNTAQYFATAVFSDGSMREVSPNTWDENSSSTTISNSGLLMAGQVSADTTVKLYASYTYSGVTREAYKDVTVINQSATFSYLAISGPSSMNENSSGQFTATAIFSDGSSQVVTPSWSENSTATRISNGGLLTADDVVSDTTVTVSAIHTIGSITQNASQNVLIVNIPTPPTLISLAINGASSVNENSTAQYSATAYFSDGSSSMVTSSTSWSENSSVTTFPLPGLLSAESVSSDTLVTVSASYTLGGITKNAQKSVTVINTDINPDDVRNCQYINFTNI